MIGNNTCGFYLCGLWPMGLKYGGCLQMRALECAKGGINPRNWVGMGVGCRVTYLTTTNNQLVREGFESAPSPLAKGS